MKYIFIVDDAEANIDEIHLKSISAPFIPLAREIFISRDGTPVYLSRYEVDALLHASQYEAFENIKKRHEQGIFDILKEVKKEE